MFRSRLAGAAVVLVIVFALGLAAGFLLPRWAGAGQAPRIYNSATIIQQVQTLSELVTVKYVLERVVVLEVPPESMLGQMFAGENRVLMLAHGVVKAGVDLGKLEPGDIEISEKKALLRLPPPQITDAYLDDKQSRVIERTTGRFRTFDKDLEQSVRQNAVDDLRRAARLNGILKDADDRARTQLKSLFDRLGLELEFRKS
jgi:hypothetical protein